MKIRKIIFPFLGLVLIVAAVFFFCRDTSILPLDPERATGIYFTSYPQYDGSYTVTDNSRVKDIVSAINELNMQEGTTRPDKMSSCYYYFFINTPNEDISVELDENTIKLNNEVYQADTSDLRLLLVQTYNDIMNGKID
mgnify:FL=1